MNSEPQPTGQGAVEFWFWQRDLGLVSRKHAEQGATGCRQVLSKALGAGWQTADLRTINLEEVCERFAAADGRLKAATATKYCTHTRRAVRALLALHSTTGHRPGDGVSRTHSLPLPSGGVTTLRLPRTVDHRDVEFLRRVVNLYADTLLDDSALEVLCLQDPAHPDAAPQVAVVSSGRLVPAPRVTIIDAATTARWRANSDRAVFLNVALAGSSPAAAAVVTDWLTPQTAPNDDRSTQR